MYFTETATYCSTAQNYLNYDSFLENINLPIKCFFISSCNFKFKKKRNG